MNTKLSEALEAGIVASANDVVELLASKDTSNERQERARIATHAVSVFATALAVLWNEAAKPSV